MPSWLCIQLLSWQGDLLGESLGVNDYISEFRTPRLPPKNAKQRHIKNSIGLLEAHVEWIPRQAMACRHRRFILLQD